MRNKISLWVWLPVLLGLQPQSLFACAACYGNPDSAMSHGLTWAITFMVGLVVCVLAGVTVFFVHMNKHSEPTGSDSNDPTI